MAIKTIQYSVQLVIFIRESGQSDMLKAKDEVRITREVNHGIMVFF